MTQPERVLRYLEEHGSISQDVTLAWQPRITRLPARIKDLEARGVPVVRDGTTEHGFARYRLDKPTASVVRCPKCDKPLDDVRETIAKDVVNGKCLTHGSQLVVIR